MACGTRQGYKRHERRRERPCEPCRLAHNAYRQRLRAAGPESARQRRRDYQVAYNRALARLRSEHLGRFAQLLNEELPPDFSSPHPVEAVTSGNGLTSPDFHRPSTGMHQEETPSVHSPHPGLSTAWLGGTDLRKHTGVRPGVQHSTEAA